MVGKGLFNHPKLQGHNELIKQPCCSSPIVISHLHMAVNQGPPKLAHQWELAWLTAYHCVMGWHRLSKNSWLMSPELESKHQAWSNLEFTLNFSKSGQSTLEPEQLCQLMVLYTENLYHSNTKAKDVAGHSHIYLLIAQIFCSPYPHWREEDVPHWM